MRVQSEETNAVRAGLQPDHPQERAQGSQLRTRAAQSDTVAAAEAGRYETRTRRATAADQRAQTRDSLAQGLYARPQGVEPGDARDR